MDIKFSADAEAERLRQRPYNSSGAAKSWSMHETTSLVDALHTAKKLGWKEKKVQVREEEISDGEFVYYVEPWEKGCGCRGLLRYKDFFD